MGIAINKLILSVVIALLVSGCSNTQQSPDPTQTSGSDDLATPLNDESSLFVVPHVDKSISPESLNSEIAQSSIPSDVNTPLNDEPSLFVRPVVVKSIRVKHHKVECEGFWVQQCLLVKESDDSEWRYFYDHIEGFDFEWGHEYVLQVELENTPAIDGLSDQSTEVYRMKEVISNLPPQGESFVFSSRYPATMLVRKNENSFEMPDGKLIECHAIDCESIESAIDQRQGVTMALRHNADPSQPLELEAVLCVSSLASFTTDCNPEEISL